MNRLINGVTVAISAAEEAAIIAEAAIENATRAAHDNAKAVARTELEAVLADTPANANSILALRDSINEIKSVLRDLLTPIDPTQL